MAYDKFAPHALYVTRDGNWGGDDVIVTDINEFPEEYLAVLEDLPDYQKFPFFEAVLNGQDVSEWLDY